MQRRQVAEEEVIFRGGRGLCVFEHLWHAMAKNRIPYGIIPNIGIILNIEVSLVVQPGDAAYLAPRDLGWRAYRARNAVLRTLAKPYVAWKMKPWPVRASATEHPKLPPPSLPVAPTGGGSREAA